MDNILMTDKQKKIGLQLFIIKTFFLFRNKPQLKKEPVCQIIPVTVNQ